MNTSSTIIIAEAGVNHNGSLLLAKQLIDVAVEAGVDYVKFQTFKTESLVTKHVQKAEYQKNNTLYDEGTQFELLKKLELSETDHYLLIEYCKERGIKFLSTAFDLESIDFLESLNLGIWKVPSGEVTNYPYLKKIAHKTGQVIISTGMCTVNDIENAIGVLIKEGKKKDDLYVLHCNTEYPTPMKDVNLLAMKSIADLFGVKVGYSDHTEGIEVSIAAVAIGAKVIEKHFTLNRNMVGPDHKASLEPLELISMVRAIRNIEVAIGTGAKIVSESELKNMSIARKSIIAARLIKKGDYFTDENLTVKRPGTGVSPMQWESIIGLQAKKNFQPDDLIEL